MGVNVSWDSEDKTRLRYDFEGQWTWPEFRTSASVAFAMTRSVEHKVDTISYFHPGAVLPPDAFFQFRRAMYEAPKNRGTQVIVGGTTFITTMVSVFSRLYKQFGERLMTAESLEDARRLLDEKRKKAAASG